MTTPEHAQEPSEEQIRALMAEGSHSYYTARERLREIAYGGSAREMTGYASWGDYWKAY